MTVARRIPRRSATRSTSSSTRASRGAAARRSAGSRAAAAAAGSTSKLCVVAMALACAIALPIGLWLGHIGRGAFLAISVSNVGRAVPEPRLIAFFVAYLGVGVRQRDARARRCSRSRRSSPTPTSACAQVDRDTVDAARGMGMTGPQIVRRVELPLALAAHLRRHPDVGRQRRRHRHDRAARRRRDARRPDHQRERLRRRRAASAPRSSSRCSPSPTEVVARRRAARGDAARAALSRRRTPRARLIASPRRVRPPHEKRPRAALAALAALALALGLVACGGDDNDAQAAAAAARPPRRPSGAAAITKNADNASTTLTVGSKNFTEQQVLGEIYAQALAAAGYKVKKRAQPRRREDRAQGAQGRRHRRLPRVHGHGAAVVLRGAARRTCPRTRRRRTTRCKTKFAEQGITALPADAVHVLQRGRRDQGDRRQAGPQEHLRPRGQVAGPHALRLARVPRSATTACSGCRTSTA